MYKDVYQGKHPHRRPCFHAFSHIHALLHARLYASCVSEAISMYAAVFTSRAEWVANPLCSKQLGMEQLMMEHHFRWLLQKQ